MAPLFSGRREKIYDRLILDALLDRLSGRANAAPRNDGEAEAEALRRVDERANAIRN